MTAEEAFERYHQSVFAFVYRMTRRVDIAEDVTQESFMVLVRAPDKFDSSRATLKTYLLAIARNLALARLRANRREPQLPAGHPDPEVRSSSATSTLVENAVSKLPHLQREALILFEYEGLTLHEIATVIETDTGTVKSRLHRARANLKRILAPVAIKGSSNESR